MSGKITEEKNQNNFFTIIATVIITSIIVGITTYVVLVNGIKSDISSLSDELNEVRSDLLQLEAKNDLEEKITDDDLIDDTMVNNSIGDLIFTHTSDWVNVDENDNFVLWYRFASLYSKENLLVLSNGEVYFVATVDEGDGSSQGIFMNEQDKAEYEPSRVKISALDTQLYLTKSFKQADQLVESESGPYLWSSISEYLPEVDSGSVVYEGYDNLLHHMNKNYNFVIVSNEDDPTSQNTIDSIVDIVESFEWK